MFKPREHQGTISLFIRRQLPDYLHLGTSMRQHIDEVINYDIEFVLHQVGTEGHVLEDINSLITTTDEQGDVFKDNQTVRVIDSIATSIASVFASKYIGKVPNDASGRISLWSDIVKIHQELNDIQAIEDFESEDIVVEQGDDKKSVVVNSAITVVNTMTKLYMKTIVG